MRAVFLAVLMLGAGLAGCTGGSDPLEGAGLESPPIERDPSKLAEGRGAISGLLIDDRFRPLKDGSILLQERGTTTRSNADGVFQFLDVPPGTYTLRTTIEGHEARVETVTVEAGAFAELDIVARRVVSLHGSIITQEYSVFIPCAADYVANGGNLPCTLELGPDSYSSSFFSNLTELENVTYVITEMKANQENSFEIQLRASGDNGTERYAVAQFAGDYVKIVNKFGEKNDEHENARSYGENVPFVNAYGFTTILFVDHDGRQQIQDLWPDNPVYTPCCGVGFSMGVKARFVQSIFIGEPEVDIERYQVYR